MENMDYYLLSAKISGVKNIQKRIYLEFYKKTIDKQFDPDKYRLRASSVKMDLVKQPLSLCLASIDRHD